MRIELIVCDAWAGPGLVDELRRLLFPYGDVERVCRVFAPDAAWAAAAECRARGALPLVIADAATASRRPEADAFIVDGTARDAGPLSVQVDSFMRSIGRTRSRVVGAYGDRGAMRSAADEVAELFGASAELAEFPQETLLRLSHANPDTLEKAVEHLARVVGVHDFSELGEPLVGHVARLLRTSGETVAVAESCTGGLLGAALTQLSGSSSFFVGGALTYSNHEKTRALGVPAQLIERHGAVSEPVARAMASGIRERTGATHGVAITGIAGPEGGSPEKPVGTVWVAVAGPRGDRALLSRFTCPGREAIRRSSVAVALDLLRRSLENPS